MKNFLLGILILLSSFSFGQKDSNSTLSLMQSDLGLHYINENSNCNYIVRFLGEDIKKVPEANFLELLGQA